MKILFIVTEGSNGGAQKYVLQLARHFGGRVASGGDSKYLEAQTLELGIPFHKIPSLQRDVSFTSDIRALFEIRKLVKEIRPDIVHLNSSKVGVLGSLASINLPCKVIFTAHGFVFKENLTKVKKNLCILLESASGLLRSHTITVSNEDKVLALRYRIAKPNSLTAIPNGIKKKLALDRNSATFTLKLDPKQWYVGVIANLYKNKGIDLLIEAAAILKNNGKLNEISFVVIGEGPEREQLTKQIEKHSLEERFILAGEIPGAEQLLSAFNIYCQPSRKEGAPFALLEAMNNQLPIIATDLPSVREVLGESGIYTHIEQPEELAHAISALYNDPGLQQKLGEQAAIRANIFTEERMVASHQRVFAGLFDRSNAKLV